MKNSNYYKSFNFPAGEVHLKDVKILDQHCKGTHILQRNMDQPLNDQVMEILLLNEVMQRNGIQQRLYIPYMFYSRQDRPTKVFDPFALKVFGKLLNDQNFKNVVTLDVHSDVAHACVDRLINIPISFIFGLSQEKFDFSSDMELVIPDQGAYKRLESVRGMFNSHSIAIKSRNTYNGYIEIETIVGDPSGKDCIIIDDICDGGMTFILLAKRLKEMGAESIKLFVTHGIFSKGLGPLWNSGIDTIITTNSFKHVHDFNPINFHILDCLKIFERYLFE